MSLGSAGLSRASYLLAMHIWSLLEVHTSISHLDILMKFSIFVTITAAAKFALFRRNAPGEE